MYEFLSMEKPLIIPIQPLIVEISNAGISSLLDRFSDKSDGLRGKYPIKKMENWFEIANCLVQQRKNCCSSPDCAREEWSGLSGVLGTCCGGAARQKTHGCCVQTVQDRLVALIPEVISLCFPSYINKAVLHLNNIIFI